VADAVSAAIAAITTATAIAAAPAIATASVVTARAGVAAIATTPVVGPIAARCVANLIYVHRSQQLGWLRLR